MRSVAQFFAWFLLVPYFAVRSLNVRPWFEGQRDTANRTNAQLALAVIFSAVVVGTLALLGYDLLEHLSPYVFGFIAVVPPAIVTSIALNREREKRYWTTYKAMPIWRRAAFGLSTLALVSTMLWQVPTKPTRVASPLARVSCDDGAQEVSAASCSAK